LRRDRGRLRIKACKNRAQNGAILAVAVRMEDRRECSGERSFHKVVEQARWMYNGAVFEVKQEIPVKGVLP
jgi:hypothetical protein